MSTLSFFESAEDLKQRRLGVFKDLSDWPEPLPDDLMRQLTESVERNAMAIAQDQARRRRLFLVVSLTLAIYLGIQPWLLKLNWNLAYYIIGFEFYLLFLVPGVFWYLTIVMQRSHPDAQIIDRYLTILCLLQENKLYWDMDFKRTILTELQRIASLYDRHLPRSLLANDRQSQSWFGGVCSELGKNTRILQQWVMTPKLDTPQYFRLKIWHCLVALARGDWDSLRAELSDLPNETFPSQKGQLASVIKVAAPLIACMLAFVVFVVVSHYSADFRGTPANWTLALIVILTVVCLVRTFNPQDYKTILENTASFLPKR